MATEQNDAGKTGNSKDSVSKPIPSETGRSFISRFRKQHGDRESNPLSRLIANPEETRQKPPRFGGGVDIASHSVLNEESQDDGDFFRPTPKWDVKDPSTLTLTDSVSDSPKSSGDVEAREASTEEKERTETAPIRGFLISYDRDSGGDAVPIRLGRWIISSERSTRGDNYIVVSDKSISAVHAVMEIGSKDEVEIRDQLSERGTKVKAVGKKKALSITDSAVTARHGDIIRFGDRNFHLCMVKGEL